MMKDIEIKISRETRMVDLSKTTIGNDGENLQGNLVFSFTDDFVKGQGRLEYIINGESKYAFLLNGDENYYIPIKSVMTKEGQIDMQLVITEGTDASEIPIFKSNVFYVSCKKSINAEVEEEEEYYSWIEIANTKLNEIDKVVEDVETKLANGEFNGKDGVDGKDGKDGKDFTYEDFTEEQLENLRGPQGEPGKNGEDYVLTEQDKQEIESNLSAKYETYLDNLTPKNTSKGELVHITDALPLPTFETTTDGNVKQETTTGKNLLPYPYKDTTKTTNGITFTDNKDGTITANGTATADAIFLIRQSTDELASFIEGTNYILSGCFNDDSSVNYNNAPYYIENEWSGVRNFNTKGSQFTYNHINSIRDFKIIIKSGTTVSNLVFKPMIRLATITDDTYEKFTNGASPNPEYPQEIEVVEGNVGVKVNGKNLAKSVKNIPVINAFTTTLYINTNLKPNTTYTIGFIAPTNCKLYFNENLFKWKELVGTGKFETYTITTLNTIDKNQYYVGQGWLILKTNSGNTVNSVITDVMLVEGVVNDLTYEPYQEQIVPLDLKGNFVGKINDDIKDYLVTDKKKYWLVKNVGKVVLDGSENWQMASSVVEGTIRFYYENDKVYNEKKSTTTNIYVMSDKFIGTSWISIYSVDTTSKNLISNYNDYNSRIGRIVIRIDGTVASSIEEFKQWLSENNVTVYYQLAKPQIIELGELPEPIKTFEGVNNIQLLANLDTEIEVKYALDIKKYYDNKLAEISAQII